MTCHLRVVPRRPSPPPADLDLLLERACKSAWTRSGQDDGNLLMTLGRVSLERRRARLVAAAARWLLQDSLRRLAPAGRVGIHLWAHRERCSHATALIADSSGLSAGIASSPDLERAARSVRQAGCRMVREQTAFGIVAWIHISPAHERPVARPNLVLL